MCRGGYLRVSASTTSVTFLGFDLLLWLKQELGGIYKKGCRVMGIPKERKVNMRREVCEWGLSVCA